MIVLQASHITKQYDGHEVLKGASVVVQHDEKVALVGANGAGKSTLLKVITGDLSADTGEVSLAKGATMGYVSQFTEAEGNTTLFNHVAATFSHLFAMEARLREMEQLMSQPDVYEDAQRFQELSAAYDRLQQTFTDQGGYAVEARVRRVLDGLSFPVAMHQRLVQSLSGGQKTRLALARLLAWEPDLLILDEPTNYLDTETLTWLESYLQGIPAAVLVVSHDRYFLDKVATVIYELDSGKTARYVGNYSAFIDQKANQYESDLKRFEAQQAEIAKMEEFIQKNIVRATTTKRAQSRRKMLERMVRMEKPSANTPKMALAFAPNRQTGRDVLRVAGLVTGYADKPLAGPFDLYVSRGQRLAMVGPNGIGKTTLLKTLIGELPPLRGTISWGAHVDIGYYDQEQTGLDAQKTVLTQIWDDHPKLDQTTVRTALGRFLFRGEDINKPVAGLSGGERSRLALCRLMLTESNVLVMDEPTNHLDLLAKEVLEDALADYEGTLIMVSHDRYFIDAIATHVLSVSEDGVRLYIGNYTAYMEKLAVDRFDASFRDTPEPLVTGRPQGRAKLGEPRVSDVPTAVNSLGSANSSGSKGVGGLAREQGGTPSQAGASRKVRSADVRKLRDRVAQLEQRIAEIEARQSEIGTLFLSPATVQNVALSTQLQAELDSLTTEHVNKLEEWEAAAEQLESMEGE